MKKDEKIASFAERLKKTYQDLINTLAIGQTNKQAMTINSINSGSVKCQKFRGSSFYIYRERTIAQRTSINRIPEFD